MVWESACLREIFYSYGIVHGLRLSRLQRDPFRFLVSEFRNSEERYSSFYFNGTLSVTDPRFRDSEDGLRYPNRCRNTEEIHFGRLKPEIFGHFPLHLYISHAGNSPSPVKTSVADDYLCFRLLSNGPTQNQRLSFESLYLRQ